MNEDHTTKNTNDVKQYMYLKLYKRVSNTVIFLYSNHTEKTDKTFRKTFRLKNEPNNFLSRK